MGKSGQWESDSLKRKIESLETGSLGLLTGQITEFARYTLIPENMLDGFLQILYDNNI